MRGEEAGGRVRLASRRRHELGRAHADHSGVARRRAVQLRPSPPNPGISGDGWIGWSWQKGGWGHYLIPPDVHCTETDGELIVDAQAPQMAAVDANPHVVDWQFVAWSMVIYKENAATQPPTWSVIQQTPFYWSKPTDLFDVALSAVAPNNWRVFSAAKRRRPAFSSTRAPSGCRGRGRTRSTSPTSGTAPRAPARA